ncbi:MAG: tripartite tricarboxylate transporter substrate binding protein [Betaproteobacteria bacterium]|nr:MAG: tripartite tricarboxylate transporter substrate binding protein [Betaproteobacteria bacterium]
MLRIVLSWALALGLTVSATALGQPFPNRPIRVVIPFEPGGSMDVVGRSLTEPWGSNLKQQIVIDNRGGAGGTVGTTIVAKATPDGYTILYANLGPLSIGPSLYRKLGYDLFKDLAPVSLVGSSPIIIFVLTSLPVQSVKDFIAYAKARPGQLNFASSGIGSGLHLTGELFNSVAGIEMVHVPFKGIGQAASDIASGRIQVLVNTYSGTIAHLKAGRLRPVITGGTRRSPNMPDVPTGAEAGLPGFESTAWHAAVAPAGTPQAVIAQLNQTLVAALATPELRARLAVLNVEPIGSSPEELGRFLRAEWEKWSKVIKSVGIKPQ